MAQNIYQLPWIEVLLMFEQAQRKLSIIHLESYSVCKLKSKLENV